MKLRMMPLASSPTAFLAPSGIWFASGAEFNRDRRERDRAGPAILRAAGPDPVLRNCIDHGIEPPEERVRNGKPPTGIIRLEASKERESVVIRVNDDGRGMDPAMLRRTALERGVITREQHDSLPDGEVLNLITLPGFSTAKELTDVSGRGVGMDVVRSAVESLRGSLLIESVTGQIPYPEAPLDAGRGGSPDRGGR
jgi:two-component system chemotaxis sensor kinase CheA